MRAKRAPFHQSLSAGRAAGVLAILLTVLPALTAPSKAQQQISRNVNAEPSYDYLYAGFFRSNFADEDASNGFGIEFAGSKSFGDNFHVWGNGGRNSFESTESDASLTDSIFNIGVGTQLDVSEYASVFARIGFIFMETRVDSVGVGGSGSWDGYIASLGVKAFPIPKLGLAADVERIEIDDETEFVLEFFLGVSAQYRLTDEFMARAFIQRGISDEVSDYNVLGAIAEYRFTSIVAAYASATSVSPDNKVDVRAIGAGLRFHLP
ncbi:MAG: outer membrane beta-barrel protein [Candidatus Poribacteria bacterium]|nr:outer membrane beta-barrel protein [Candidatus Poribacteria bacterium]